LVSGIEPLAAPGAMHLPIFPVALVDLFLALVLAEPIWLVVFEFTFILSFVGIDELALTSFLSVHKFTDVFGAVLCQFNALAIFLSLIPLPFIVIGWK
jgi:hypothetical protein